MKLNITVYELWFWRIFMVVSLLLVLINYVDNRKQDELIFKTIDEMQATNNQITQMSELFNGQETINSNNLEIMQRLIRN